MKKHLSIALAACIFFGLSGLALSEQGVTDDMVKIGIITDFTGATSAWGEKGKMVGDMWQKEINSHGGINGRKIELLWEDHGYRPDRALTGAKKLINFNKVFCLMAGQCTPWPPHCEWVQKRFSGDSITRRYLTVPGSTPAMWVPS